MNTQTQQMLTELKSVAKLPAGSPQRVAFEDKYPHSLPLSSGTLAYATNLIPDVVDQVKDNMSGWAHCAALDDPRIPPALCNSHVLAHQEIISFLSE